MRTPHMMTEVQTVLTARAMALASRPVTWAQYLQTLEAWLTYGRKGL